MKYAYGEIVAGVIWIAYSLPGMIIFGIWDQAIRPTLSAITNKKA
jgi:hypothetical protein